jgi:signal peptidase I
MRPLRLLWEWTRSLATALVFFLILHVFLIEAFKIPTGSMEGTLQVGDFLLVNKLAYGAELPMLGARMPGLRQPTRGEVVVFRYPPEPTQNYVKRVVGLPGDTIAMVRADLIRNGVRIPESYVRHAEPGMDPSGDQFSWQRSYLAPMPAPAPSYYPSRDNWGPLIVPERHYFVLGDNRDNSSDSRYWGFVPDSMIRGTPLLVYYSFIPDSAARFPWLTRVRWDRIGERIR